MYNKTPSILNLVHPLSLSLFPIGIFIFGSSQMQWHSDTMPLPHYRLIISSVNESSTFLYDQSVSIDPTAVDRRHHVLSFSHSTSHPEFRFGLVSDVCMCLCSATASTDTVDGVNTKKMIFVFPPLVSQFSSDANSTDKSIYV